MILILRNCLVWMDGCVIRVAGVKLGAREGKKSACVSMYLFHYIRLIYTRYNATVAIYIQLLELWSWWWCFQRCFLLFSAFSRPFCGEGVRGRSADGVPQPCNRGRHCTEAASFSSTRVLIRYTGGSKCSYTSGREYIEV